MAEQAGTTHAGIVLAAGSGTRVGNSRNKAYLPLAGRRIVTWSLELFRKLPGIGRLVLVVRDDDRELAEQVLDRELPGVPVDLVTGGQTRHEYEYRALLHLADEIRDGEIDVVLVHDAARPLAPVRIVEEVLATAIRTGSAIPALPLEDAVGVDEAGRLSHAERTVEHRVRTKPRRMLRRVIRHPVAFALDLPEALLVKPAKMEAELRVLYGRR